MTDVTVLTSNFEGYKSIALVTPVLRYKSALEAAGFDIDIAVDEPNEVDGCDCLLVSDRVYMDANHHRNLLDDLKAFQRNCGRVVWLDTTDGTTVQTYGSLDPSVQTRIIPNVDRYCKKQLLSDRERYLDRLYGSRLFTDFYASNFETERGFHETKTDRSVQVEDADHLDKLGIFWNLGMAVRVPVVDRFSSRLYTELIEVSPRLAGAVPWTALLDRSVVWPTPDKERPNPISGRFSTGYDSEQVQFHRELITRGIGHRLDSERVGTVEYWRELRRSKILLSPFGWGEVCHRDFEGFLSGCLVLKPRMDHLETWPSLYEDGDTVLTFEWDASDLESIVDSALDWDDDTRQVARRGQSRYREVLLGESAEQRFVDRFRQVVEPC